MTSEKTCIHLSSVTIEHAGTNLCENISLVIDSGTLAAFTGKNPICWNIVMRMVGGLQAIPAGLIELWGVPVNQISRRSLNSLICFVPRQQHPLFAYPVIDYVLQGCESHLKPLQAPTEADRERAREILRQLHIEKLVYRDSSLLSNLERQLVVIARALMQDARLLMIDEPYDSLNGEMQLEILNLLQDLAHHRGRTVVLGMQDPAQAVEAADRLIIFDNQGIADVLDRHQDHYNENASQVLQRLMLLDPAGHLLDILKQ